MADNILVMDHITKEFPGVKALDNVNLEVQRGEIHALIGENGAGKSTLMNVLSGQYPYGSYTGTVTYEGEECKFKNLNDSEAKGIVIIHQELALIPLLSIGENMFLGNEIKNKSGSIDWDRTYSEAEKHMAQVGLHESAQTLIKDIGTGKQQLVEIAKAFSKKVKLLILDEPTSSLNVEDAKMLRFNTTLARLSKVCEKGVVNTDMEVHLADEMTKEMGTKTPSNEQKIGNLSGGNQQKALLGKWMFTEPDILILDEPTRGIDVGAKYDIYCLINKMVEDGKSVIMISSEMPELLGMCDRIYVMSEGRLAGEFTAEEATQERIMASIMQEQNKK